MVFNFKKSVTFRLLQASKAQRARAGGHLSSAGLHPGQELVLKVLTESDGSTMSQLAHALSVQPPTVTKMVTRLSAQGLVRRELSDTDGRLARVFLTEEGQDRIAMVDRAWKRLEKEAMAGLDDRDRRKLRKLLRHVERNLSVRAPTEADDDEGETEDMVSATMAPALQAAADA